MKAARLEVVKKGPARRGKRPARRRKPKKRLVLRAFVLAAIVTILVAAPVVAVVVMRAQYTFSFRSPVSFQWPLVFVPKAKAEDAREAQIDQDGHPLTAYQQYTCKKFGPACRVALAIQRAENPTGACEIFHYNRNGTLDWGYFQINTVHLEREELHLRDLLDCKANIDFAYQLYLERGFEPWSTYNNGAYQKFLHGQ